MLPQAVPPGTGSPGCPVPLQREPVEPVTHWFPGTSSGTSGTSHGRLCPVILGHGRTQSDTVTTRQGTDMPKPTVRRPTAKQIADQLAKLRERTPRRSGNAAGSAATSRTTTPRSRHCRTASSGRKSRGTPPPTSASPRGSPGGAATTGTCPSTPGSTNPPGRHASRTGGRPPASKSRYSRPRRSQSRSAWKTRAPASCGCSATATAGSWSPRSRLLVRDGEELERHFDDDGQPTFTPRQEILDAAAERALADPQGPEMPVGSIWFSSGPGGEEITHVVGQRADRPRRRHRRAAPQDHGMERAAP